MSKEAVTRKTRSEMRRSRWTPPKVPDFRHTPGILYFGDASQAMGRQISLFERVVMNPQIVRKIAGLLLLVSSALAAEHGQFAVKNKVTLDGEDGWDYLAWDGEGKQLFISRGTKVMVVDPAAGKQTAEILDTQGVHGIALAPELGKGFISAGRANTAVVFDLKTLKETARVKTGENPDAIVYDPASKRVFTLNGHSGDATAIDAATNAVAGTIPLGGKPEFAVADGKGTVFVNIEDKAELVAIDSKKLEVTQRWKMGQCEEPSGLAMDREHRRLFAGCSNREMAILDADSGRLIAEPAIGGGVDACGYDAGEKLAFSSNGEGTITVIKEESPDKFAVAQTVTTQRGARTMALDPRTHTIYTVTADLGPPPEGQRRPSILPGTFVLITVGK